MGDNRRKSRQKAIITSYALVFGFIFLLMVGGLLGFVLMQMKQSSQKVAWNQAFQIAEAGADYYRWCLNNGAEANCLTEKEYENADGKAIGRFSLQIESTENCGEVVKRVIASTGWTYDFPDVKREVRVLYAKTSVAKYAYLLNNNVWAGADREIGGPYHSNGGIRMDGENNSLVTSAQEDWICTDSFGCSTCPTDDGCWTEGSDCVCPGVFTTTENSNEDLFDFPATPFDFNGITVDLANMKNLAKGGEGLYFASSTAEGYRVVLQQDRSVDVWRVDSVNMLGDVCAVVGYKVICDGGECLPECPSCDDNKCVVEDPVISSETYLGNFSIPSDCGLVFFEDNLWIGREDQESKVKGKITIVAADLEDPNKEADVWLQGDITYASGSGTDGLSVLGQHDNLIGLYSPNQMEINGIFIAQNGRFGRNYYSCGWWSPYYPYCVRDKLEINGSVISNGRVGTKWGSSAGYLNRENYFDENLIYDPPPFVPSVAPDFKIVNWEEVE